MDWLEEYFEDEEDEYDDEDIDNLTEDEKAVRKEAYEARTK